MSLQVHFEWKEKSILVVRLSGELDHHTADQVREQVSQAIEEKQVRHLILNLENLSFMDSSGLGVILGRYKQMKQANGEMIICSVPLQSKDCWICPDYIKLSALIRQNNKLYIDWG